MGKNISAALRVVNRRSDIDLAHHSLMSDIGKRVRALRKALGFTQVQLAKRVGVSQSAVSDIERGDTTYVLGPTLSSLAAALRTNTDWLMSGNGSAAPVIQTDDSESELLAMFRAMDAQSRAALLTVARSMYKGSDFGPSVIDPYPKAKRRSPTSA
jgi:transcriptional regulator with XRE-family HTH domain